MLTKVLEAAGAVVQPEDRDALVVRGLPIDEIGDRAHDAGIGLHELSPHSGSLEDLFLDWTGAAMADIAPETLKEVVSQ
jgi:ABC-2 type transport system ATP-binding protein